MVKYNKETIKISDDVARVLLKAKVDVSTTFQIKEIVKVLIGFNSPPSDNNDFKKPCPRCGGTGNVPEEGFEYPDLCCPTCNGQGFIKS